MVGVFLGGLSFVEQLKTIESKIHVPIRYLLMAVCALLVLVFYLFTRKCGFFTFCAFFPALFMCMKSIAENKGEEKKWAAYWCVFSFCQLLPSCLDKNMYYVLIKFAALVYFAFFDDCTLFIQAFEEGYKYITMGLEWYQTKYCKCEGECTTEKKEE